MSRRPARLEGSASVAIFGAPSEEGAQLRELLSRSGVDGKRVDLYAAGAAAGDVLLSEYAGEARMIQPPDVDEIAGHDVIFICEAGPLAVAVAAAAGQSLVIDLLGCLPAQSGSIRPQAREEGPAGKPGRFAVPHPIVLLLAELLAPLERKLGLEEVTAVVLRPASDFGRAGVEELKEQTLRLLNFGDMPVETFGRQLAFNVIPQCQLGVSQAALESRIRRELAEILDWKQNRFAIRWVAAPMFHGHAVQLHLRLGGSQSLDEVRTVLTEAGLFGGKGTERATTPLDVIGEVRLSLSDLSDDGLGAFWLWVVAGETATRGAQYAVRLAAKLGRL